MQNQSKLVITFHTQLKTTPLDDQVNYVSFQENCVVPLIKLLSIICVLLGFVLFALRMEYQPSFTNTWFSSRLDQPFDMEPFDWGAETTKTTERKTEGSGGE